MRFLFVDPLVQVIIFDYHFTFHFNFIRFHK